MRAISAAMIDTSRRDLARRGAAVLPACPRHASFLRLMFCLDGMQGDAGATEIIPGSHLVGAAGSHAEPAAVALEHGAPKMLLCPPGSLVVLHPLVVHGGAPNFTPRHRRNIVVQWGRADDPVAPGDAEEIYYGMSLAQLRAATKTEGADGIFRTARGSPGDP